MKPGPITLSRAAFSFMRDNFGVFLAHLVFVLPMIVLVGVGKQLLKIYGLAEWMPVTILPTLFIYGCFVMSWHRTALNGPDRAHRVNPLTLNREDGKFLLLFIGVMGAFTIFTQGLSALGETVLPQYGRTVEVAGAVISFALMLLAAYILLRLSFLFPAQAQGVSLSTPDLLRASRGMVWPLLGTNLFAVLMLMVLLPVYMLVAGMVSTVMAGDAPRDVTIAIAMSVALSLPIYLAIFFMMAFCTTALSRAYQWGMQNNPL